MFQAFPEDPHVAFPGVGVLPDRHVVGGLLPFAREPFDRVGYAAPHPQGRLEVQVSERLVEPFAEGGHGLGLPVVPEPKPRDQVDETWRLPRVIG